MPYRLQSRLWTKDDLVARAAAWARAKGWRPITTASLLKWKQEGLLPRPVVRSLGRGRGSESGWPSPCYRQLLQILAYRNHGLTRWRDLRIALWLDGYAVELTTVQTDLEQLYGDLVGSFNKALRTEEWSALSNAPPSTAASRAITRRVVGPDALDGLVRRLNLDPLAEPIVRMALSLLLTPEGQRTAVAFVHQFFATGPGDIPAAVAGLRDALPPPLRGWLDGAGDDFVLHAGLLAHPDGFNNPMLRGIAEANEETLLNLRAAANAWSACWPASLRLVAKFLEVRPEALGAMRLLAPVLEQLALRAADWSLPHTPTARVVVLGWAVANESVRGDQGHRAARSGHTLRNITRWLTDHPDVLRVIDQLSNDAWRELAATDDFPPSIRALILPG
jgi:hypothetical protein